MSLNLGGDITIKNQPSNSDGWETLWDTGPARFTANFPAWVLQEVPDLDYPDATGMRRAAPFGERWGNPYTNFNNGMFSNYTGSRVFTDLILDQKLDKILKGLSIKGKVSLSTYYNITSKYSEYSMPQYYLNYDDIGKVGVNPWERLNQSPEVFTQPPLYVGVGGLNDNAFSTSDPGYYFDIYYEASLNYSNTFGKHTVSGMALLNRQQKNILTEFTYYNEAVVGRATYDYAHKYLLELNIGYTGS